MKLLIEKELNSSDRILKPDCTSKSGRELLAFYLQAKFKQILLHDQRCDNPLFISINPAFVNKFSRRLIDNPSFAEEIRSNAFLTMEEMYCNNEH